MSFRFSKRSLANLVGVDKALVDVTLRAIELTKVDFAITCGRRSVEEQKRLVATGASQTMKSKHITGEAVDCVAFINRRISWELPLYKDIADAFKLAAHENGVAIRWGGAWIIKNFTEYGGNSDDALKAYIKYCAERSKSPFIDSPHFELADEEE